MATVTKSSIKISRTLSTAVEATTASVQTTTYTVATGCYAIVNVYATSIAASGQANYSIATAPGGVTIQPSIPVITTAPVRTIYMGEGEALTVSVASPSGGTTRMTITVVEFVNS